MRIVGLDPGLRKTGWGIIDAQAGRLSHVANGVVRADASRDLATRLVELKLGIDQVIANHRPDHAAVEESLANKNPSSTLKLGMARGAAFLASALNGLPVSEYLPMIVKKSVVGTGHAGKQQVEMMVRHLLPGCEIASPDAADALAIAICHAHHLETQIGWSCSELGMAAARTGGAGAR